MGVDSSISRLFFLPLPLGLCYRVRVSFSPFIRWFACLVFLAGTIAFSADTYELLDGRVLTGPPQSITKDGVVFKESSDRIGYTNLSQTALQELLKNPRAKKFAEPFLEMPLDGTNANRVSIEIRDFERIQRPDPNGGLKNLMSSGLGLFLVGLLMVANLYAGYEVGVFRNYSPWMVMGISLVLPVVTQIIFLCLPTYVPKVETTVVDATGEFVPDFAVVGSNAPAAAAAAAAAAGGGAGGAASAPGLPTYKRGEFTFNKRFFETKMAGFFGVRPTDAEKGLVFEVKANRGHLLCNRVVRVTPAEVCFQVLRGTSVEEVSLPFTDVMEIEIKQRGH